MKKMFSFLAMAALLCWSAPSFAQNANSPPPAGSASGAISGAINNATNSMNGAISGAVNNAVGNTMNGAISGAVGNATGALSGATGALSGATGALSGATGALSSATGALSGATGALSGATGALSGATGALSSATGAMGDAVSSAVGDASGAISDAISGALGDFTGPMSDVLGGAFSPPAVGGGICSASCCSHCPPVPCDHSGAASQLGQMLSTDLYNDLSTAAATLETYLRNLDDNMMQTLLTRLNKTELDMIDWWENTFWLGKDGLLASMKAMTVQLNTALVDQAREFGSALDASNTSQTVTAHQKQETDSAIQQRPTENACTVATAVGGYGKTTALSRAMRNGWQNESLAVGLNKAGTVGAAAAAEVDKKRVEDYQNLFCDPNGNGGHNNCGKSDPAYYNADTQPTKYVYNKLTIDVTDPKMAKTAETILNNMVGVPSADPISKGALQSATGEQTLLDRRAYLARYAALRSVPQMIAGWRTPGGGAMAQWIATLREGAGVQPSDVSNNPSYKEILHAVAVDKFNSGQYALGMISNETQVEEEKAILNAFYLMQLRDYYELLERTALTLAVQVSVMADQVGMPDTLHASPLNWNQQGGH